MKVCMPYLLYPALPFSKSLPLGVLKLTSREGCGLAVDCARYYTNRKLRTGYPEVEND